MLDDIFKFRFSDYMYQVVDLKSPSLQQRGERE